MPEINDDILGCLANLFIITDETGKIIRMNKPLESLLSDAGTPLPTHISQIDPALYPFPSETEGSRLVRIGKIPRRLRAFPLRLDRKRTGRLFLFDAPEILKEIDFDVLLNYIDDAIVIADHEGVLEHVNSTIRELSGINFGKGSSVKDGLRSGNLKESATLRVLQSKKTERINVRYNTGKTLTFTSIPLFGKDGDVNKIISTGRDVTKLLELQEELHKAESLKDHYLNRLSTLESIAGSNTIVHSSDEMKRVVSLAIKAARSDSPAFIWGESGVGKELIADLIHKSGNRSKHPFIGVNCSAIPSELLESEFFGYVEGAFTGAKKGGNKGLFEEAGQGTLFLDEITEVPFPIQSKLLRVLQEREFMRVGGTKTVPLKARIISSSNLTKAELSDSARFRRDLFYRLNVIPIYIPPLRQRQEDIFPLVHFFLKNMNLKYNANVRISPYLMTQLYRDPWPGNVRELKNVIERMIVMADKDEVDIRDYRAISQLEENENLGGGNGISVSMLMPLKEALLTIEDLLIRKAFKETGSIPKAAEALKISPSTIYRKVEKGQIRLEG